MDYRTLFIFDVVSLACYAAAISTIALRYRRMIGLRWFSASVLLQLAMTMLQTMRGVWPAGITVLLPTILDGLSFFAMYMGFHWTLIRKPLRTMVGPVMLYMALTGYSGLELLHTPFDFAIGMAPVFVCAGLSAGLLLRYGHGSFKTVSRVTAGVLFVTMMLTIYRTVITVGYYGYDAAERGIHDARLLFAMLGLMVLGGGMVLMYLWFFVSERWADLSLTARLDPLTGILNRRAVDDGARREISRARRTGTPLALLVLDIDHFKRVNDVYGHRGGDESLRAFVAMLQTGLRQIDLLGRIGGEEFVMFLPDTTTEEAAKAAERLRAIVEATAVPFEEHEIRLTMTTGVTQLLPDEESWEGMLSRADEALYTGKREGRNRIVIDQRASGIAIPPTKILRRFVWPIAIFGKKKSTGKATDTIAR